MSIVQTVPQLPAHLAVLRNGGSGASNIIGGISLGASHPKISIRSSRFHIVDEKGEEETWDNLSLDLIILDGNPNISKRFYIGAYDPSKKDAAPDCASDNGATPNAGVAKPQAANCMTCPNNAWGSKITPTGKAIKACSDSKRLAVIIADEPDGLVYELSVPAASLTDLGEVMGKLDKTGIPVQGVRFKVSFDPAASFPKLLFQPMGYINETEIGFVQRHLASDAVAKAIGTNEPVKSVGVVTSAPQPVAAAVATMAQTQAVTAEEPVKRRRRSKADMEAANSGSVGSSVEQPPLPFTQPAQAGNAQTAVQVNPQPTDNALDALLAGVFGTK